jgi:2'-5' RNA ligase
MAKKTRAFVAIEAGPVIREACNRLSKKLAKSGADVNWADPDGQHLTLKFLGDIDLNDVAEIYMALERHVGQHEPFEIEIAGAGAFPDLARPRTIWAGVREGLEPLQQLFDDVEECLRGLGFRKEARKFVPHVTLGRLRDSDTGLAELSELIAAQSDAVLGVMEVEELILYSSQLERTGPVYEPMARVELKGKG